MEGFLMLDGTVSCNTPSINVIEEISLVKRIAWQIHKRLPPGVSIEDLIQDGCVGLIEAVQNYAPQESSFYTYAGHRIRGAILDGLRRTSTHPRSYARAKRQIAAATDKAEKRLLRRPRASEIAFELGISLDQYYRLQSFSAVDVPFEERMSVDGLDSALDWKNVEISPEKELEDMERDSILERAIRKLSGRKRFIFELYAEEGYTCAEIGALLRISESRVSQLMTDACHEIQEELFAYTNPDLYRLLKKFNQ